MLLSFDVFFYFAVCVYNLVDGALREFYHAIGELSHGDLRVFFGREHDRRGKRDPVLVLFLHKFFEEVRFKTRSVFRVRFEAVVPELVKVLRELLRERSVNVKVEVVPGVEPEEPCDVDVFLK